jgi:hypothetical protein
MSDTTSGHFTIQTNQKDILTNSRVGEMKILKRRLPWRDENIETKAPLSQA